MIRRGLSMKTHLKGKAGPYNMNSYSADSMIKDRARLKARMNRNKIRISIKPQVSKELPRKHWRGGGMLLPVLRNKVVPRVLDIRHHRRPSLLHWHHLHCIVVVRLVVLRQSVVDLLLWLRMLRLLLLLLLRSVRMMLLVLMKLLLKLLLLKLCLVLMRMPMRE